jgi:hypothetical protein
MRANKQPLRCRIVGLVALCAWPAGLAAQDAVSAGPMAGSPGGKDRVLAVRDGCPTFSWSESSGRYEVEIAAYRLTDGGLAGDVPVLNTKIGGSFSSWTPSLDECLPPGSYAWVVRAQTPAGWSEWSEPRLFEVRGNSQGGPRPVEREPRSAAAASLAAGAPSIAGSLPAEGERPVPSAALPTQPVTGEIFSPPACTSHFNDVGPSNAFCPWIEQLWRDQITGDAGCGGGNYCPKAPVTREQLALFLERSMRGTDTFRPGSTTADIPNRTPAAATITPLQTTGDVGQYSSITTGVDGLGLISYWDASQFALTVAHCSNVDCSEATVTPIDFAPVFIYSTSIAIGADGFGLISYYDGLLGHLRVAHCANVECTSADAITPVDTSADVGRYSSITIGTDGLGLISYYDATNRDLKVSHCSNPKCTTATIAALDTNGDTGASTSIAIGGDGLGLISYHNATSGELTVAHCADVICGVAFGISPLYGAVAAGSDTSITTGADGLGLISFYSAPPEHALKVGHCQNSICTALDQSSTVSLTASNFTSITIGADGLGLLSYYEAGSGDLRVAHCPNTNCAFVGNPAITSAPLDISGDVGQYNAITIGADGLGLISYYDATNHDLKVAHCSNVLCAPYFRRR